jgi:hypothetical protein
LLVTLHDPLDAKGHGDAGQAVIRRRYRKARIWEPIARDWLVLAPIAASGGFVGGDGLPRSAVFQRPFSVFWKHVHVDFDRILLDGAGPAFTIATEMPVCFAGIVLRGGWKLDDEQKAEVCNFAPVPVYVVDDPALARQLRAAGHPHVTLGAGGHDLLAWMAARHRRIPTTFRWNAHRPDEVLAWWIDLDQPDWDAKQRTLDVEVVDTEKAPNTIHVTARGIHYMSFFLNDDIVDLDRPLRILVNGHLVHKGVVPLEDPRMAKLGRDLDLLFDREPLRIRDSMCFGWLTPERIMNVRVEPP